MQTQREYLFGLGFAKAPTGRGRFSRDAHDALARARERGVTFSDDAPKVTTPTVKRTPKPATVKVDTKGADPKAVRKWAGENGITVGARGRIHESVYAKYFDSVAPEAVEARESEFDVYAPTAPHRYPEGTVFKGSYEHKGKTVDLTVGLASVCYNCHVSLIGHRCNNPMVVNGNGTGQMHVTPIFPKGVDA